MDKVQIYACIMLALQITCGLAMHGEAKKGVYDFRWVFFAIIVELPIYGRALGWW